MIKGVIFDLDGVLVDSAQLHLQSWQSAFRNFGIEFCEEDFWRCFGQSSLAFIELAMSRGGVVLKKTDVKHLEEEKERIFRDLAPGRIRPFPGVIRFTEECKYRRQKTGIASSAPIENIQMVLKELGIEKLFDAVTSGGEVKFPKPHPQIFIETSKRLNLSPSECIVFEDVPVGLEAARRAGCTTVAVTNTLPAYRLSMADLVVASLEGFNLERFIYRLSKKGEGRREGDRGQYFGRR
jgi:HAD superfamily hydrolase (TIGR01509 family)